MFRKHFFAIIYSILLTVFTVYMVLDTFVITRVYAAVPSAGASSAVEAEAKAADTEEDSESHQKTETGTNLRPQAMRTKFLLKAVQSGQLYPQKLLIRTRISRSQSLSTGNTTHRSMSRIYCSPLLTTLKPRWHKTHMAKT